MQDNKGRRYLFSPDDPCQRKGNNKKQSEEPAQEKVPVPEEALFGEHADMARQWRGTREKRGLTIATIKKKSM